jgi:hypothetical protein
MIEASSDLWCSSGKRSFCSYTRDMASIMFLHHEFMCIVVDMDIFLIDSDIGITKELGHLLERDSFGFRKEEPSEEEAESGEDDEYEVELPADRGKGLLELVYGFAGRSNVSGGLRLTVAVTWR